MGSKFVFNGKASRAAVEKAQSRGTRKRFKVEGEKATIFILAPVSENEPVFGTNVEHQHFGDGQFICGAASPTGFGQKDKIMEAGWKLKAKYDPKEGKGKPHPEDKIRYFWKSFMPKKFTTFWILDLKSLENGAQLYDAPAKVTELIFDEIKDLEDDLTTICSPEEGRKLLIKKTGKKLMTRYMAKFGDAANVELSEEQWEEINKQIASQPLSKLQTPLNESNFEKVWDYLLKRAAKLKINLDDLDADDEESDDEEDDDSKESDDSESVGEGDITEADDEELEEEEEEL